MIKTKNINLGLIIIVFFAFITSCDSSTKNEKLIELQDAKAMLERNIAMYDETWNIFLQAIHQLSTQKDSKRM